MVLIKDNPLKNGMGFYHSWKYLYESSPEHKYISMWEQYMSELLYRRYDYDKL
jgi:hypothetical protein